MLRNNKKARSLYKCIVWLVMLICAALRVSPLSILHWNESIDRWKTDLGPKTRQTLCLRTLTFFLLKDATDALNKYLCTPLRAILAWARWQSGEVIPGLPVSSHPQQTRTWWVSCMWGLSYSQTKLNEEGLIWPECPALLNRTLSLRALLKDNVCFVAQSSERGGWERVEGDGGSVRDSTQLLWQLVLAPWVH